MEVTESRLDYSSFYNCALFENSCHFKKKNQFYFIKKSFKGFTANDDSAVLLETKAHAI